jgi:hypothetical protein
MLVAFNVAGREYRATYDPGRVCRGLPEGGAVTVSANPADPASRIVIVDHGASQQNLLYLLGLMSLAFISVRIVLQWLAVSSHRRVRALSCSGIPWRQLTATVLHRSTYRGATTLNLQGMDASGSPRIFGLVADSHTWSHPPVVGGALTLWMICDGKEGQVLLASPERTVATLGGVHVPNGFELRTRGF